VNFSTGAALKCSSPREAFSRSHPALLLLKLRLLPFDAMTEMNQASYWPFYFQELTSTAATNNHFLCTIQRPVQFLSEGAVGFGSSHLHELTQHERRGGFDAPAIREKFPLHSYFRQCCAGFSGWSRLAEPAPRNYCQTGGVGQIVPHCQTVKLLVSPMFAGISCVFYNCRRANNHVC
jgi:hypothetical protein